MTRGVAGGRAAALLIKARGGFYVSSKPESPAQAAMREQMKINARQRLAAIGIDWKVGRVK